MRLANRQSGRAPRRGVAMIAVLVVVTIMALAAYRFSDLMQAEQQAADSYTRALQARALANSGINYAATILANPDAQTALNSGNPYNNPTTFQSVLVQDNSEARLRGRFSLVSPLGPDAAAAGGNSQTFNYGVTDEGGKININALFQLDSSGQILYNVLMQLPNMTDPIANSMIFWIDPSATPRSSGATDEYYSSLSPSYHAKNAPLDGLEELLYVQGVTPQLLFGNDKNRNGILDADEDDGSGVLDMGWSAYLTAYSREQNISSSGSPRIWINDPNLQSLQGYLTNAGFDDSITSFIIAARMYGVTTASSSGSGASGSGSGSGATAKPAPAPAPVSPAKATPGATVSAMSKGTGGGGSSGGGAGAMTVTVVPKSGSGSGMSAGAGGGGATVSNQPLSSGILGDLSSAAGKQNITSLYSLINAQVTIPATSPQSQAVTYNSPMTDTNSIGLYLPLILDQLTTSSSPNLTPRININTAPSAVLSALAPNGTPLLDPSTVQTILSTRPANTSTDAVDPTFQTAAWLITQGGLTAQTMQSLEPYITGSSQVYRVQSLGYFDVGGPTARVEAVIDTNGGRPRILYYRDLTELGKGYNLQQPNQ